MSEIGWVWAGRVVIFAVNVVTVLRPQISSPKQRGLVGWANRLEGVEDTQVVGLVAALFPFPPLSGSFHGLKMLRRLVCFPDGRPVFLRENSTWGKKKEHKRRKMQLVRVALKQSHVPLLVVPERSGKRGCRINPSPLRFPGPPVLGQNVTVQATEHPNLPLNEPQNGGRPLGRSLLYPAAAQRTLT